MSRRVYLDHAATAPLNGKVRQTMADFESEFFGNPSSLHLEGQAARARIDTAREEVARAVSAKPQEMVFTSGATEANNLAVLGVVSAAIEELKIRPHVVTTMLEHQSVYQTVRTMEQRGIIEATYLKPDRTGMIAAEDVIRAVKDNTVLVSVIFVSNEIGSVLPVREIGRLLADVNAKQSHRVYFHTDAVQAFRYHNCHAGKLGVDLMTLSAHKLGGPKGVGALFVKSGTKLHAAMSGGSQEYGLRPGTQNTAGIIGFAEAIRQLGSLEDRQTAGKRARELSDYLIGALKSIPDAELNGPTGEGRTPDNINFTVRGLDQDTAIARLDLAGFAVSTGSACVSGSSEPSHVILSLGKNYPDPSATIRVTVGPENTPREIEKLVESLKKIKA